MSSSIEIVRTVYDCFQRGDIQGVLAHFGNECEVEFLGPKNIPFAGSRRIQLRAEGFNITNHVNLGLPQPMVFNAAGRVANAGQITTIVGTARQWQFGVKVDF